MKERESIINYCNQLGLDTIGFTTCRKFDELIPFLEKRKELDVQNEFEEENIDKRINPFIYMPEGKTIISIAFPYLFRTLEQKELYFSKYTLGMDYHKVVKEYLTKICTYIKSLGGKAEAFVDSNCLPERYIAYLSSIGFIGKNNMLITEKYGSFVFLGEIITDMDLLNSEEKKRALIDSIKELGKYNKCGTCNLCLEECPTKSIKNGTCNANVCLSYITQKKHIEDKWFKILGSRLFGCDSCQDCCPHNRDISFSPIEGFSPREYMKEPTLEELVNLDNSIFKEKYANTSCGWRGKNVIIRNALIAASNEKKAIKISNINSPYVRDYYDRLLKPKDL